MFYIVKIEGFSMTLFALLRCQNKRRQYMQRNASFNYLKKIEEKKHEKNNRPIQKDSIVAKATHAFLAYKSIALFLLHCYRCVSCTLTLIRAYSFFDATSMTSDKHSTRRLVFFFGVSSVNKIHIGNTTPTYFDAHENKNYWLKGIATASNIVM